MDIPIPPAISPADRDGFAALIRASVFDERVYGAPITAMKFSLFLDRPPLDNTPIGGDEFRNDPVASQIPREYLLKLAEIAKTPWKDALQMSVYDLVVLARAEVTRGGTGDESGSAASTLLRPGPENAVRGKAKVRGKKRGKALDGTTKLDQACEYLISNPSLADISNVDFSKKCGLQSFAPQ